MKRDEWRTDLEEGEVLVLQRIRDLQILHDDGAVGVHPHHVVIVIVTCPQQRQLVTRSLTH